MVGRCSRRSCLFRRWHDRRCFPIFNVVEEIVCFTVYKCHDNDLSGCLALLVMTVSRSLFLDSKFFVSKTINFSTETILLGVVGFERILASGRSYHTSPYITCVCCVGSLHGGYVDIGDDGMSMVDA